MWNYAPTQMTCLWNMRISPSLCIDFPCTKAYHNKMQTIKRKIRHEILFKYNPFWGVGAFGNTLSLSLSLSLQIYIYIYWTIILQINHLVSYPAYPHQAWTPHPQPGHSAAHWNVTCRSTALVGDNSPKLQMGFIRWIAKYFKTSWCILG